MFHIVLKHCVLSKCVLTSFLFTKLYNIIHNMNVTSVLARISLTLVTYLFLKNTAML